LCAPHGVLARAPLLVIIPRTPTVRAAFIALICN